MKLVILAAIGVSIYVGLQIDEIRVGANLSNSPMAVVDLQVSAADLLSDCGYDLDEFEVQREPSSACAAFIRESMRLAIAQGNLAAGWSQNGYGRLCMKDPQYLSDHELARLYVDWAWRDRQRLLSTPADLVIVLALDAEYRCPLQPRGRG